MELHLMIVSNVVKIKFGRTQISVPKIGIPMCKTACCQPLLSLEIVGERVSGTADWDFTLASDWHGVFDVWPSFLREWTESSGVW